MPNGRPRLWTTAVTEGDQNRLARFGGGASYDSGTVFASDGLGDVIAANAADGKVLWRAKPSGPLVGADHRQWQLSMS